MHMPESLPIWLSNLPVFSVDRRSLGSTCRPTTIYGKLNAVLCNIANAPMLQHEKSSVIFLADLLRFVLQRLHLLAQRNFAGDIEGVNRLSLIIPRLMARV